MTLKEYCKKYKFSFLKFCKIVNIPESTMTNYFYMERVPHLINAIKIVRSTNYEIDFIDLIPPSQRKKLWYRHKSESL